MIEHDLARIASALEQIAYVMTGGRPATGSEGPEPSESTDIDAQAAQARGHSAAESEDAAKREHLKADLRLLGVAFKDSARTSTLQKLLDDKLASMPHPEQTPEVEEQKPEEQKPEEPATATRDDVRLALIELSAAKGKDSALATLHKVGGAEKLSDVNEDRYSAIVAACKEQCHA